jgi:cysteinyl-tRNA synthetase
MEAGNLRKSATMTQTPALSLYNTLTRSKQPFQPIDPSNVRMYVCGPTVYDYAHIGNARPAIVFDVLFRLLKYLAKKGVWDSGKGETKVTYVRNITDVDDKINARALRDHPELPLNEAIRAVTEKTLDQYLEDVAALGCLEPTFQPRATEHIDGMIAMIETLIANGNAYVATGGEGREVLFDVTSMPAYGKLSNRKLDEQQAGARIAVEAHKKNPADFVLWKESSEKEPGWHAEFDGTPIYGRPGWHLECSVMSEYHLGEVFDIHGGGLDLIFPHHENEIAQSCCAHGTDRMANVWMHNGFLQVEGKKMSKSEGNFVTIHELFDGWRGRKWTGAACRLAMLKSHYSQPIDWTYDRLIEASADLANYAQIIAPSEFNDDYMADLAWHSEPVLYEDFLFAIASDLNTPAAIAEINELAKSISKESSASGDDDIMRVKITHALRFLGLVKRDTVGALRASVGHISWGKVPPEKVDPAMDLARELRTAVANENAQLTEEFIRRLFELGFKWRNDSTGYISLTYVGAPDKEIQTAIDERLAFIAEKNWAEADRIRDELLSQGIQLKDSKDSETGERITTWEVKR